MAQTNNSFLADKVALRANHLPDGDSITVLDCYAGSGKVWAAVKKLTGRKIDVLPIDTREYDNIGFYLPGNNLAYLQSIDIHKFDVIDLDAYGVPFDQLDIIFKRQFKGTLFVTFIQSVMGGVPTGLLESVGFSAEMVKRCPTLFYKSGWKYFLEYLSKQGVRKIWHRSHYRKHYIGFNCADLGASRSCIPQEGRAANRA